MYYVFFKMPNQNVVEAFEDAILSETYKKIDNLSEMKNALKELKHYIDEWPEPEELQCIKLDINLGYVVENVEIIRRGYDIWYQGEEI